MSSAAAVATGSAGDPGTDLAAAAVAAMSSTGFVRAAADAIELQAIATLARLRRQQAVARARSAARQADVARGLVPGTTRPARVDVDLVDRLTSQEVSVALTLSPVLARERLELARELVERRPVTFEALRQGQVDLVRARRICDAVRNLPAHSEVDAQPQDVPPEDAGPDAGPVLASAVEAEALFPGSVAPLADLRPARPAGELTPAQLTARLTRLVMRADPDGATDRTRLADTRRGCSLRGLPDGMALLSVTGRAELLGAAFTRLDRTARQLLDADAQGRNAGTATPSSTAGSASHLSTAGGAAVSSTAGTAAAGQGRDAARTMDQTRVDVLLATLLGDSDDITRAHNVRIDLALVATAGTVLGGGDEAGDLDGHGPVPAPLVRALAADARWRRWDTDPTTGHITATTPRPDTTGTSTSTAGTSTSTGGTSTSTGGTSTGTTGTTGTGGLNGAGAGCGASSVRHRTYRPSAAVADLIRARDQTCRFPTCRRRAEACDLDHVTPFPHGPTCPTTMATECRLHHICKHQGGFSLSITPDGSTTWTTPTGQQLTTHPPSWGLPPPTIGRHDLNGAGDPDGASDPSDPLALDARGQSTESEGDPPF